MTPLIDLAALQLVFWHMTCKLQSNPLQEHAKLASLQMPGNKLQTDFNNMADTKLSGTAMVGCPCHLHLQYQVISLTARSLRTAFGTGKKMCLKVATVDCTNIHVLTCTCNAILLTIDH